MRSARYIILVFGVLFCQNAFTQVAFKSAEWDAVLRQAEIQEKIVFVDVYTKWCGPCKKMDKETFRDATVSAFMNEKFINVKWDAESPESAHLARKYSVRGFPTFLFISHDGSVIKRQSGYQNAERFIELAEGVHTLTSASHEENVQEFLSSNPLNYDAIKEYLHNLIGYKFQRKQELYNALFDHLKTQKVMTPKDIDILVDNIYTNEHLSFTIQHFPDRKQSFDRRINRNNQKTQVKTHINNYFKQAIQYNNHQLILDVVQLNLDFDTKINGENFIGAEKENNDRLLEFYRKHFYKDDYYEQAQILVKDFIDPYTPEMIDHRDEQRLRRTPRSDQNYIIRDPRIRLKENRKFAYQVSNQLNEVASVVSRYFDNTDYLIQALSWTEKAQKYVDLPEARLTRAEILKKLGMRDEALFHITKAEETNLLNDKLRERLNIIKASLIN